MHAETKVFYGGGVAEIGFDKDTAMEDLLDIQAAGKALEKGKFVSLESLEEMLNS